MNKLAEKIRIDLTDLENLLEGVVAYVEVRTDDDDISYQVAKELRELGATISENRNSKVTHVIFRNGTLRTSNWAKKHDIPLVGLGWIVSCTKNKTHLLSRPWHIRYLVQEVDIFGSKKKPRYKKYFKNMNIEEYEAELQRSKKKRKKQLEKSLNNSKSDNSLNTYSPEHDRIMKRSDPMRIPPVPDVVKRYVARLERYKQTGRYSWESSTDSQSEMNDSNDTEDEDPKTELTDPVPKSRSELIDPVHKSRPELIDSVPKSQTESSIVKDDNSISNTTETKPGPRKLLKGRRLFKELNQSQESLIEPIHQSKRIEKLKNVLPDAVHKNIIRTERAPLKRPSRMLDLDSEPDKPDKKQRCFETPVAMLCSDITLPKRKISLPKATQSPKLPIQKRAPTPEHFVAKREAILEPAGPIPMSPVRPNRLALQSPLIRSVSANSNMPSSPERPDSAFVTPKTKKRLSLRTRLLKRQYRRSVRNSSSEVLVPGTEVADRPREFPDLTTAGGSVTIFETPSSEIPTEPTNDNGGGVDNSFSSAALGQIFDTPNMSRTMDQMLPNRVRPSNYQHVLFIAKDDYDHCLRAIPPDFVTQARYISDSVTPPSIDRVRELLLSSDAPRVPAAVVKRNCRVTKGSIATRRSSRHSKIIIDNNTSPTSGDITDQVSVLLEPLSTTSPSTDSINPALKRVSIATRRSARHSKSIIDNNTSPTSGDITDQVSVLLDPLSTTTTSLSSGLPVTLTPVSIESDSIPNFFHPPAESQVVPRRNTRRSSTLHQPAVVNNNRVEAPTNKPERLKRTWAERGKPAHKLIDKPKNAPILKVRQSPRLSSGDFISTPPPIVTKRVNKSVATSRELILIGFSIEEQQVIKQKFGKLPSLYYFGDMIRSREQIVVTPENPKRSAELIKAFVFGAPLVSVAWIHRSLEAAKWLNHLSFIIKDSKLIGMPVNSPSSSPSLFSDYSAMYLAGKTHGIHKYKLRIIIETAGGKVTDSFRQAGVVINTRKVNALSVTEHWILDSVKQGQILNPKNYLLL